MTLPNWMGFDWLHTAAYAGVEGDVRHLAAEVLRLRRELAFARNQLNVEMSKSLAIEQRDQLRAHLNPALGKDFHEAIAKVRCRCATGSAAWFLADACMALAKALGQDAPRADEDDGA